MNNFNDDICQAVAAVITKLREPCNNCNGLKQTEAIINGHLVQIMSEITYQPCHSCNDTGWLPTQNLHTIITNIEYPLTLVLKNDIIGWSAKITLDGNIPLSMNKPSEPLLFYDNPVYAVYEALFEALTDKLGEGRKEEFESQIISVKRPRRSRGRGRLIKSKETQESV